jgi:hopene-associated glycosyltransferase HpnB
MTALAALAALTWAYLLLLHGRFWQAGPVLPALDAPLRSAPSVAIVVPARNEAEGIRPALASLLAQAYAGDWRVILVDDQSTDATGAIARAFADPRLTVLTGRPRPAGWSGKLWAVAQGVEAAGEAALILLTDADIIHDPRHLATLVAKAEADGLDLVSEMVALSCESWAERALVPAFVFFFQLLYPFARVNEPESATAAAAGGTILVRNAALRRIGGIATVRGALIDDVALAKAIKRGGPIWLGHSTLARSIRPYPAAADIWRMVARTAYVQLRYSPLLLAACILGMALTWLVPPAAALTGTGLARWLGLAAWAALAAAYLPTLRRFRRAPLWAPLLPLVALFYMAATVGSALDHMRGRGVVWKQRAYRGADA